MALLLHQSFLRPLSYSLRCALPNSLRCLFIITLINFHYCRANVQVQVNALVVVAHDGLTFYPPLLGREQSG